MRLGAQRKAAVARSLSAADPTLIRKTQLTARKQLMAWKMSLTACETTQKRHQEVRVGSGVTSCIPEITLLLLNKKSCCTCDLTDKVSIATGTFT